MAVVILADTLQLGRQTSPDPSGQHWDSPLQLQPPSDSLSILFLVLATSVKETQVRPLSLDLAYFR